MPFLNNKKFQEIKKSAGDGNEKASMVLQALRQGTQDDVDRLVKDFYAVPDLEPIVEIEEPVCEEKPAIGSEKTETICEASESAHATYPTIDLTDVLDKETDGLFDENEIDNINFSDFLNNKRRDNNRLRKNAEYFNAFDSEGRKKYAQEKKDNYKSKFSNSVHDIEKQFNDYDKSIDKYSQSVNDLLDDEENVNIDTMSEVYNSIIDNDYLMHGFGRYWDDDDTSKMIEELKSLVIRFGKKNVLSALNVLKNDNSNFKDYKLGQINEEVERYNKSLDKILK